MKKEKKERKKKKKKGKKPPESGHSPQLTDKKMGSWSYH